MRRVSSRDAVSFAAWRDKNPHWSKRIIHQLAQIAFVIYTGNGGKSLTKIDDFIMKWGEDNEQTDLEMEAIGMAYAANAGGLKRGERQQHSNQDNGQR